MTQLIWTAFALLTLLATFGETAGAAFRPPPRRYYSPIISFNLDEQDIQNRNVRIAAREGSVTRLEEALLAGGRIDSKSDRGATALMNAARTCRIPPLRLLLRRGANVNLADTRGRTALMFAAGAACLPAVKLLLREDVRIHARDQAGRSALDHAASASTLEVGGPAQKAMRLIRSSGSNEGR